MAETTLQIMALFGVVAGPSEQCAAYPLIPLMRSHAADRVIKRIRSVLRRFRVIGRQLVPTLTELATATSAAGGALGGLAKSVFSSGGSAMMH